MVMTGKKLVKLLNGSESGILSFNRNGEVASSFDKVIVDVEVDGNNVYFNDLGTGAIIQSSLREDESYESFMSRVARNFNKFFKLAIEVIVLKENGQIKSLA
jgi:hypothetical protein